MSIQQHPIPQHISSYEFHLVGDMTLKQFCYLAGGAIVALFFYSLPIAKPIRWTLMIFSGFIGFAFAFIPLEERPLSVWFLSFIKSTFSPTLFIWQKKPKKLELLESIVHQTLPPRPPHSNPPSLQQYLLSLPQAPKKSSLDKEEEEFLDQINHLFQQVALQTKPTNPHSSPPPGKEEKVSFQKTSVKPPIEAFIYPKSSLQKNQVIDAKTNKKLPIPVLPSAPNIVSGMVFNKNGEIVSGAILEIRNEEKIPVRALKTNNLGQFIIATPLENGTYEIEIEKEGLNFDIIKFDAKGEIIPPLEIRSK